MGWVGKGGTWGMHRQIKEEEGAGFQEMTRENRQPSGRNLSGRGRPSKMHKGLFLSSATAHITRGEQRWWRGGETNLRWNHKREGRRIGRAIISCVEFDCVEEHHLPPLHPRANELAGLIVKLILCILDSIRTVRRFCGRKKKTLNNRSC